MISVTLVVYDLGCMCNLVLVNWCKGGSLAFSWKWKLLRRFLNLDIKKISKKNFVSFFLYSTWFNKFNGIWSFHSDILTRQWQAFKQQYYANTLIMTESKERLLMFEYVFECLHKTYVFINIAIIILAICHLQLNVP